MGRPRPHHSTALCRCGVWYFYSFGLPVSGLRDFCGCRALTLRGVSALSLRFNSIATLATSAFFVQNTRVGAREPPMPNFKLGFKCTLKQIVIFGETVLNPPISKLQNGAYLVTGPTVQWGP